ncbi:MAG: hypothetical protein HY791_27035 [Deltaproteobacteria bacterium]|nr:hypothetical protein [Deltaproteobacteria bacterium]
MPRRAPDVRHETKGRFVHPCVVHQFVETRLSVWTWFGDSLLSTQSLRDGARLEGPEAGFGLRASRALRGWLVELPRHIHDVTLDGSPHTRKPFCRWFLPDAQTMSFCEGRLRVELRSELVEAAVPKSHGLRPSTLRAVTIPVILGIAWHAVIATTPPQQAPDELEWRRRFIGCTFGLHPHVARRPSPRPRVGATGISVGGRPTRIVAVHVDPFITVSK